MWWHWTESWSEEWATVGNHAGRACLCLLFADNLKGSIISLLIPVGLAEAFSHFRGFSILSVDGLVPCMSLAGSSVAEAIGKRDPWLPGM